MAIKLETIDFKEIPITDKQAIEIREAWILRDRNILPREKMDFLNTIAKIKYSPEQVFCLHRFKKKRTIEGIHGSQFYIMICKQCDTTFTTDIE